MYLWSFYFFVKFYLHFKGHIPFHVVPNLLLAIFLSLPWLFRRRPMSRPLRVVHLSLGLLLAIHVLWGDSHFPPLIDSLRFVGSSETRPSFSYMLSFLSGYWDAGTAVVFAGLLAAAFFARMWEPFNSAFVLLLMAVPAIQSATRVPPTLNEVVERFYSEQAKKSGIVRIAPPSSDAPPFDIVFLHVCSMSWDDLAHVGLEKHPFFSEFDLLLTRFNTVTSYSNPSALRLLRAPCGQTTHDALYGAVPEGCYLLESLRHAGYRAHTVFNSDGNYAEGMIEQAVRLGKASAVEKDNGNPTAEFVSFDNSSIYSNYAQLEAWWKSRLAAGGRRAALYYNSMTLHGGVHAPNDSQGPGREPRARYKDRVLKVFGDYSRFFELLKASGRDVLVVMVPEHGAALVGNRLQAGDLRDLPFPSITTVPVGFKFIGKAPAHPTRRIERTVSYQAIAYVLSEALRLRDSAQADPFPSQVLSGIPETPFLSENEHARVVAHQERFYLQGKDRSWTELTPDLFPTIFK
jgi:cellulose synthase operon protein YhjU